MSPPLTVSSRAARLFLRRAQHLDAPFGGVGEALRYLGFVQIDPINVCGRMHDLILRNRVASYAEGDLMRFVHGGAIAARADTNQREVRLAAEQRQAFEHHLPGTDVLVALPVEDWPHLLAAMHARAKRTSAWSGRLTPRERELAPRLLAEIAARGPLGSEDIADTRRAHRVVWGAASLVKSTLQKLFFHGRILIADRLNNRRRYDLPERVLPAKILAQSPAEPSETARWLVLLKLRQRRLAMLRREEWHRVDGSVRAVEVDGCPPLFCLRDDVTALEQCVADAEGALPGSSKAAPLRLLAPLDPLIYDRRVTAALWNFDYTWEVYTPPAKRVRGYYALPVLAGVEIVGHVDPKVDRVHGKLIIASRQLGRGHRWDETLKAFAQWLGARQGKQRSIRSEIDGAADPGSAATELNRFARTTDAVGKGARSGRRGRPPRAT